MADTLVTAVDNVITRVLIMEKAAVSDAGYATKRWIEFRQDPPYWVNRVGAMSAPTGPEELPEYDLNITMRLILDYHHNAVRDDDIDGNAQEKAWGYEAATMRYFERYRHLDPPGYARLNHVGPGGCVITCPMGMDLRILSLSRTIYLTIDFELTIPLVVGSDEV